MVARGRFELPTHGL